MALSPPQSLLLSASLAICPFFSYQGAWCQVNYAETGWHFLGTLLLEGAMSCYLRSF